MVEEASNKIVSVAEDANMCYTYQWSGSDALPDSVVIKRVNTINNSGDKDYGYYFKLRVTETLSEPICIQLPDDFIPDKAFHDDGLGARDGSSYPFAEDFYCELVGDYTRSTAYPFSMQQMGFDSNNSLSSGFYKTVSGKLYFYISAGYEAINYEGFFGCYSIWYYDMLSRIQDKSQGNYVYKVEIDFASLPNLSESSVEISTFDSDVLRAWVDESNSFVLGSDGVTTYPLSSIDAEFYFTGSSRRGYHVYCKTNADYSAYSAHITVKYTTKVQG